MWKLHLPTCKSSSPVIHLQRRPEDWVVTLKDQDKSWVDLRPRGNSRVKVEASRIIGGWTVWQNENFQTLIGKKDGNKIRFLTKGKRSRLILGEHQRIPNEDEKAVLKCSNKLFVVKGEFQTSGFYLMHYASHLNVAVDQNDFLVLTEDRGSCWCLNVSGESQPLSRVPKRTMKNFAIAHVQTKSD